MSTNSRIVAAILGATLSVLLLSVSLPATATLRTIERAYELTRNQVQLPGKPEGGLTVRPCPTCRLVVLRVTPATAWFDRPRSPRPAGQATFLEAFRASATNPGTLVYVYYEPKTLRVRRIVLDAPVSVTRAPATGQRASRR